jgi:osmotically-inducible protein OsmY
LWWSPFVDSDDVNVTVDDGVVTLTGAVDSWSEYNAAANNAYEGG